LKCCIPAKVEDSTWRAGMHLSHEHYDQMDNGQIDHLYKLLMLSMVYLLKIYFIPQSLLISLLERLDSRSRGN